MFERRQKLTTPRMPVWDGRPGTAIQHLDDLQAFLTNGQVEHWRQAGATEEEIAREAPKNAARLAATFDQWRSETRARLGLDD